MRARIFVIVDRSGYVDTRKTTGFELKAGQRAIPVNLSVPDEVFSPPLLPDVNVNIAIASEIVSQDFTAEVPAALPAEIVDEG
jgi:hypothetical protein